jgi:cysteinyl-tRNA synthetase
MEKNLHDDRGSISKTMNTTASAIAHIESVNSFKNDYNSPENRNKFAFLSDEYKQEIEILEALLATQKKFAERYENLFNKYNQKLNDPNLTDRQRNRYQKLWTQYAMLYVQYCHN